MRLKVGHKLILIYLVSLCLALSAVLITAQSIISQQVQRRHQKKLDALVQSVFFRLEQEKDQIRLLIRAIAHLGQMGLLVDQGEVKGIRRLVYPVFKDSGLDVLYMVSHNRGVVVQFQSDRFTRLGRQEIPLIRKAILGDYRVRLSRWEGGIFLSGSAPIYIEETGVGQVYAGILLSSDFVRELAKDTDAFMAIIKEGKVIASTFSKKGEEGDELEFSEELLQDIKALQVQTVPVDVEDRPYTMKSIPLRDEGGNLLGLLAIGLSRSEYKQTAGALTRNILLIGAAAAGLGVFLTFLLTHGVRKQINHLAQGTKRISTGALTGEIPVTSRDELGNLARSFNQMTGTLKERDRGLEEEKEKILANVDFLSMMVHDVKAPIAGVRLMMDILLEEELNGETKQRLLGMRESIEELLAHLQNVLSISQIEKGPFTLIKEAIQLNSTAAFVRSQCQILAESKGIQSLEDYDFSLPEIPADEFFLERLVHNLLINALHWAPRGGWVRIRTGRTDRDQVAGVFLEVSDNGPGVSPEQKRGLFQKFNIPREKGRSAAAHSGLGLYIAQIIARAHGGMIEEHGDPEEGARFVCFLPLHSPEE
jgi:two-component system, OmpR family, sensor histidine kinase BaeS